MLTDLYYIYMLMGRQHIREDVELVQSFETIPSVQKYAFQACAPERVCVGTCWLLFLWDRAWKRCSLRSDMGFLPSKIPLFRWKMIVLNMTRLLIKRVKSIVIQPC